AAISGILEHAAALPVLDLPRDLAAELEVVPLVVDGPAPVGLHVNGVADSTKNFVQRLFAGLQADVGHPDQRQARPTRGAHGAIRTLLANRGGGFARGHIDDELAVANDVGALRGHALVIESERAEAWAMLGTRVADGVHNFGAIAQVVQ